MYEDAQTEPEPVSKLIPETIPEPIPESIPESTSETDSGPTVRNRFQKTSELAGIDSDENFIVPITSVDEVPL